MVASYCCYCIKFVEHEVVLDSSSSSSPCIAVAVVVVVVLKNVDDWRTRDCVENRDPILLDIDSDKRLSLLSMTMSLLQLPVVVVAAVDNNTHSNHLHCF